MNEMQAFNISSEGFTQSQIDRLEAPLDASLIRHRTGSGGRKLAYLKGSTEIEYANKIFGYGKWGYRIVSRSLEKSCDLDGRVTGYFYTVDLELLVSGAMFPFPGDGVAPVTANTPDAHESARKAATTDALKRALRHYGNAFGLPLYDEDALVDAGDGVMVQVKEVRPGRPTQPPKRIVEAQEAPKQIQAPTIVDRRRAIYDRALELKQFQKGKTPQESLEAFLKFVGPIIDANVTNVEQLTNSRLDTIEAYLDAKDAA